MLHVYVVFQGEINLNLGELDLTSEDFWLDEVDGTVHYIFISGLTVKIIHVSIDIMVHGRVLV